MPMTLKAGLWALAILFTALLGAAGILPEKSTQFLVTALPMLAVATLILPNAARPCGPLACRKVR